MQDKDRELSKYRFSLAKETLANAKMCLDNRFFRDCINRSYYVAFYAIKAVLAVESDYSDFFVASLEDAQRLYYRRREKREKYIKKDVLPGMGDNFSFYNLDVRM